MHRHIRMRVVSSGRHISGFDKFSPGFVSIGCSAPIADGTTLQSEVKCVDQKMVCTCRPAHPIGQREIAIRISKISRMCFGVNIIQVSTNRDPAELRTYSRNCRAKPVRSSASSYIYHNDNPGLMLLPGPVSTTVVRT